MIEIVLAEKLNVSQFGVEERWICQLQITQGPETWMLPTTAPGTMQQADLQAYFDAREADLWRVAQEKRYPVDVWERIPSKRLLKAFALVLLDEVNVLRQRAGLAPRTAEQVAEAIKAKLR